MLCHIVFKFLSCVSCFVCVRSIYGGAIFCETHPLERCATSSICREQEVVGSQTQNTATMSSGLLQSSDDTRQYSHLFDKQEDMLRKGDRGRPEEIINF